MRRLHDSPGTTLELMVVATGERHCAGIDLASGALVRGWSPIEVDQRLRPYDVVQVTVADNPDLLPDPAEPDAIVIAGPPRLSGHMSGGAARRLIRPLLHPENVPLLGFQGPTVPFWERRPDHPSVAVAQPTTPLGRHRRSWSRVVPLRLGRPAPGPALPRPSPCRLAREERSTVRRNAPRHQDRRRSRTAGERLLPQGRRSGRAPPLALPATPSLSGGYDLKPEASSSDIAQPNAMRTSRRSPSIEAMSPATSSSISVGSSGS